MGIKIINNIKKDNTMKKVDKVVKEVNNGMSFLFNKILLSERKETTSKDVIEIYKKVKETDFCRAINSSLIISVKHSL